MNGTTHSGYTPDKHSAVGFNFSIVDVDLRHRLRFPRLPARRPPSSSSSVTRCCCPSSSSRTRGEQLVCSTSSSAVHMGPWQAVYYYCTAALMLW